MSDGNPARVNILGFGLMGRQIAGLLHLLGFELTIFTRSDPVAAGQALLREAKKIQRIAQVPVTLPAREYRFVDDPGSFQPALTIETLLEDIAVKKAVIQRMPHGMQDHNILTNTSSFAPAEIHSDAIGLHFFNPLAAVKLVEHCRGSVIHSAQTEVLLDALRSAGYEIVPVQANRGYLANYLLFREIADVFRLIEAHGYSLDQVAHEYALLKKPFQVVDIVDLVGVDVTLDIIRNLDAPADTVYLPATLVKARERGILGKKNGTSIRTLLAQTGAACRTEPA